jgi:hypothetical protein
MKPYSNQRSSLVLLMAASMLGACSHTGEVHRENQYEMIPAASDRMNEQLIEETNFTSLNSGPGGYR